MFHKHSRDSRDRGTQLSFLLNLVPLAKQALDSTSVTVNLAVQVLLSANGVRPTTALPILTSCPL